MKWPLVWESNLEERSPEVDEELAAVKHVMDLCARALETDVSFIEPLQLVKYTPGQYYRAHLDTHQEPERLSSQNGEQRTHTLLVFLSDVPEGDGGGHLHFTRLGLRILPRAGSAVLWRNVLESTGEPDPDSLHEGEPPLSSDKIAMNVWMADRPFTLKSVMQGYRRRACRNQEASSCRQNGYEVMDTREQVEAVG